MSERSRSLRRSARVVSGATRYALPARDAGESLAGGLVGSGCRAYNDQAAPGSYGQFAGELQIASRLVCQFAEDDIFRSGASRGGLKAAASGGGEDIDWIADHCILFSDY